MRFAFRLTYILAFCLIPMLLLGQGKPYEGPEDPAGDPAIEREGFMNGNKFRMLFNNNTQLADWPRRDATKWPDDYSGTKLVDVVCVLIGAEVYVTQDSVPVTDLTQVAALSAAGQIDTLYFVESADYITGGHSLDFNWNKTVEWALSPVPGYCNLSQDSPAMSNKEDSWPSAWPATGYTTKWPGEWNGRFGRGIKYADLESYFVANDAQDMEYIVDRNSSAAQTLISEGPRYYPRPGVYIGDFSRQGFETTTQVGFPWGGLGLRVEVRGYQWNNPESRDIIFWEYNIANISDYDLPACGFGYWIDPSIGGDTGGDSESGYFDKLIDMTYIWEKTGIGGGGLPTGVIGTAYLESPGNPNDDIDNDDDGLLNEKRDNDAGEIIGPTEGIHDLQKFLDFYHYELEELHPHYAGDEDQDWQDGIDLNGNGVYAIIDEKAGVWQPEPGENANDDVGLDGVGPLDRNYSGPDEGECNHRPDYILGVGCEPNFNATDVNESDMIGLTAQALMDYGTMSPGYNVDKDENIWRLMNSDKFSTFVNSSYIFEYFASARFPFYQGTVERISTAMLAAYEELAALNSDYSAPSLFKKKENAQVIYEQDYRFAQPPLLPTLKAYPGDGQVTLVWDNAAEMYTREPLLARVNDFEGYKLFRSTDRFFQDPEIITNAQGIKSFRKPIFQCDKINDIQGYAEHGLNNVGREGTAFYLGANTGISNSYVDKDVQNGRTYYYAIVAYDYGIEELDISPAENNIDVELDEFENVIRVGQNIQVVTPRSTAAGYVPPYVKIDSERTSSSIKEGKIIPEIIIDESVKANHTYRVTFAMDTVRTYRSRTGKFYHPMDILPSTAALYVYDETDDNKLVYSETPTDYPRRNILNKKPSWEDLENDDAFLEYNVYNSSKIYTDTFDGIKLNLLLSPTDTTSYDAENSGWVTGNSDMSILTGKVANFFPWDYDIVFTDTVATNSTKSSSSGIKDQNDVYLKKDQRLTNVQYHFYVINRNSIDSTTGDFERLDLAVNDKNTNGSYDWQEDDILVGHMVPATGEWAGSVFAINFSNVADESGLPKAGDYFRVRFIRPLSAFDQFVFSVLPENKVNQDALKSTMEMIKVVPNPYIATNLMETAVANQYLNQSRRLMFTHLPADCDIRIFTPTGLLVDEIAVRNSAGNGIAHWDLLTKENLEIASGMYVYQVKCNTTGKEKFGKFAVIK